MAASSDIYVSVYLIGRPGECVNEINASDPNLLTEIDLVNGGFRDLR